MQEMVDKFENDYKLEVNSVLYGSSCLYMMWYVATAIDLLLRG